MKLDEIGKVLEAEWLSDRTGCHDRIGAEVLSCHASDLMSDVLTSSGEGSLLLTGLTNAQVIRVAEVADFVAVCFVRGKKPQPETLQLAGERGIPVLVTPLSMYDACGRLYVKGLPGGHGAKEIPSWRTRK
jgi:predicted transcriptional regulator